MPFELSQLRYAVAAADYGSLRRASDALDVEQSTLSRRIKAMEDRLGVIIFERKRSGVTPSPAGAEFLKIARRMLEDRDRLMRTAQAAARGEEGRMSLGFSAPLLAGNLRATIADFSRRLPHAGIDFTSCSHKRLVSAVTTGALDVAIITTRGASLEPGTMLLWSEKVFAGIPATHPLADRPAIFWSDIGDEPLLLTDRDPGPDLAALLEIQLPGRAGHEQDRARHHVGIETICALAGLGQGVAIVPESAIAPRGDGLVFRELRDPSGASRIDALARWSPGNNNPVLARFIELLRERHPAG